MRLDSLDEAVLIRGSLSRKWLIAPDLNTRWSLESTALQWMLVPQQALITTELVAVGPENGNYLFEMAGIPQQRVSP